MSNLPTLKLPVRTAAGLPLSGAAAYFYDAGTSNAQDTYSDAALSSANANPVVADANGYFGEIYMKDQAYKIVVKDAAGGSTLYEVDDTWPVETTESSTATRLGQAVSSPLDSGAIGDGAADETTEVQAAIDAATGVMDLLGKTFRIDSTITVKSGLTIRNGTFDTSNSSSNEYIKALGSRGTPTVLTANAAAGAQLVSLTSVAGMSAGDLIHLTSTAVWSGTDIIGEIHEIDSIASLDVTLVGTLESAFNTAATATAAKITPVIDLRFEDLTINCAAAASGDGDAVSLRYCRRVAFDNVKVNAFKGHGIRMRECVDVDIRGGGFDEDGGAGIGIAVEEMSRNVLVDGAQFRRVATGIAIGGVSAAGSLGGVARWNSVVNCKMHGVFTGITAGSQTQYGNAQYNVLYGGNSSSFLNGIIAHGNDWNIEANRLTNFETVGISSAPTGVNTASGLLRIVGNTLNGVGDAAATDSGILYQPLHASHETKSVVIEGNKIYQGTGHGILADVSGVAATVGNISVSGNHVSPDGAADIGIQVLLDGATLTHGCRVDGNTIRSTGGGASDCILVDEADNLSISGNTLELTGGAGMCIRVSGVSDGINIADNICKYTSTTGAVRVVETNASGISRVRVAGNTLLGSGSTKTGLDFDGYINGLVIEGNNILHGTTEAAIEIEGDVAAAIVDVVIDGNVINGGDDCIAIANALNVILGTSNRLRGFTNLSVNAATGLAGGLRVIRQTVAYSDFTDNTDATGTLVLNDDIPAGAVFARLVIQNLVGFTGDTTAVMTVGDGTDVDRYHTVGTLNVVTTATSGVNAGAPVGTLWHTAAISPTLIVTGAGDFTLITAGSFVIELWFYQG